MFCITLALKDNPVVWTLLYKTEDAAIAAWTKYTEATESRMSLGDDFGQHAIIHHSCIAGAMFEDLDKSALAYVERILHNTRIKTRADKMAAADPELRQGTVMRSTPAMFDPVGLNGHR